MPPSCRQLGERKAPGHLLSTPDLPWTGMLSMDSVVATGLQKGSHCLGSLRLLEFRMSSGNVWVAQGQDLLCLPQDCHNYPQLLRETILKFIMSCPDARYWDRCVTSMYPRSKQLTWPDLTEAKKGWDVSQMQSVSVCACTSYIIIYHIIHMVLSLGAQTSASRFMLPPHHGLFLPRPSVSWMRPPIVWGSRVVCTPKLF